MSQKNKSYLKKMFVSQAIPTESDFSDLIDSVQATLVANGNIKLSNRHDGSVEISAEIPEPEPVIPKFINQWFANSPSPIYDGDGVPFLYNRLLTKAKYNSLSKSSRRLYCTSCK
jgi:hypothetical protein